MKWFLLWGVFISTPSKAIVFGIDDRVEVFTKPHIERSVGDSVAIMLSPVFLEETADRYLMKFNAISDSYEADLCKGEKFHGQPTASVNCTGFLVAPDLILTAGHCLTRDNSEVENEVTPQCMDFMWAFDYKYKSHNVIDDFFPKDNVFKCKEVVKAKFTYSHIRRTKELVYGDDYALVRLDRKVPRPILTSFSDKIKGLKNIYSVGYPSGLPMKVATNGKVQDTGFENFFTTTLDILGGNSGGPVFNNNHEVLGIVVRAYPGDDYEFSKKKDCSIVKKCSEDLKNCVFGLGEENEPPYTHVQKIPQEVFNLIHQNMALF